MNWKDKLSNLAGNTRFIAFAYGIAVLAAISHRFILGPDHFQNFLIFCTASQNLMAGNDLYGTNTAMGLQIDLFKYSPAFALLFYPLSAMPVWLGYGLWNLLNTVVLVYAISGIGLLERKRNLLLLILLSDVILNMQNSQSNSMMAGLMILAFTRLEKGMTGAAAWLLAGSVFIKLFSLPAFAFFLLFKEKPKAILHSILAFCFFALFPLVAVSFSQLEFLYQSWFEMLIHDSEIWAGISVMGIFQTWFNWEPHRQTVQLVGGILLLIPVFIKGCLSTQQAKRIFLCSLLLWVVIFNHRAESNTFIIAMAGIGVWYFLNGESRPALVLLIISLFFITFSPTDLFPKFIRVEYLAPYKIKVVPAILVWVYIQYELISGKYREVKK